MAETDFKVYGYRWVILLAFMGVIAVNQLLWITFAAVTTQAVQFYAVSDLAIGLLSLSFMAVYILVSFPASWIIDTYGLRAGVGNRAGEGATRLRTSIRRRLSPRLSASYPWCIGRGNRRPL